MTRTRCSAPSLACAVHTLAALAKGCENAINVCPVDNIPPAVKDQRGAGASSPLHLSEFAFNAPPNRYRLLLASSSRSASHTGMLPFHASALFTEPELG